MRQINIKLAPHLTSMGLKRNERNNVNSSASKTRKRPGIAHQREVIADAAVALIGARGSSATSVSDICAAAGVSRDTYYRCFTDKDALIAHLYETAVHEHVRAVLNPDVMAYEDEDWVSLVSEQTVYAILARSTIAQFLYVESADPGSITHRVMRDAYLEAAQRLQAWARQHFGHAPAVEYFMSLLFASQWLVHNAILSGQTDKQINIAKQSIKQLFYGAFASIQRDENTGATQ